MTQHVRTSYRNHRRTTWGLAIAVVVAIAAVLVPFATGAGGPSKYYTLAVSPTTACSVPTTQTFTLTLTNQTRNQNLGSANITAPFQLINGTGALAGTTGSITVNVPDSFDSTPNTIRLRNLVLPTNGSAATITVQANVTTGGGSWTSIVKQSNLFSDSGPGNLFALSPGSTNPSTTISQCHYEFVNNTPGNAQKNVAQTVNVQLQTSSGAKVGGTGNLTLTAYQGVDSDTQLGPTAFSGLTSAASSGEWSFSVVGTVSGENYSLKAGTNRSKYFLIADCVPNAAGNCNTGPTLNQGGDTGASIQGSGIASPIILSFANIPSGGAAICGAPSPAGWGWEPLEYTLPNGTTGNFAGLSLNNFSYTNGSGFLKVTTYLRNDLYVATDPEQGNDILICAGGRHSPTSADASDPKRVNGPNANGFMGRDGIRATWDANSELYFGVLERIPNCNHAIDLDGDGILDPAVCAASTVQIGGVDYRSATMLVPYDWDWKPAT